MASIASLPCLRTPAGWDEFAEAVQAHPDTAAAGQVGPALGQEDAHANSPPGRLAPAPSKIITPSAEGGPGALGVGHLDAARMGAWKAATCSGPFLLHRVDVGHVGHVGHGAPALRPGSTTPLTSEHAFV